MITHNFKYYCNIILILASVFLAFGATAETRGGAKAPAEVIDALIAGQPQSVIVLFDDTDVQEEAAQMRRFLGVSRDVPEIIAMKSARYGQMKRRVLDLLPAGDHEVLNDYTHLPMAFIKVRSLKSLTRLLEGPGVVRIYEDGKKYPSLSSSLPFISQPQVAAQNMKGAATAVAVLDTGVDYGLSAFDSCVPAPGDCLNLPAATAGCRVACVHDFAPNDGFRDDNGHGTNVSGVVVGIAPETKVIALDVFNEEGFARDSDIFAALNWVIANKAVYNIVAINMSFGGISNHTSLCSFDPFAFPVRNAKDAGILSAIASGNEAYTNGLSSPACVPAAVSVGAVYDDSITGSINYHNLCSDFSIAADKVTCFSNSADFLTILAPGASITAAGISMSGTSQATPHIAGAIAVLKGQNAYPDDLPGSTLTRMTATGVPVLDSRNRITKPRIDLAVAASEGVFPANLSISGRITFGRGYLSGVVMTLSGAANSTTLTDAGGNYAFSSLENGTYTVVPSRQGYSFTPAARTLTLNNTSAISQNFSASSAATVCTYSIAPASQAFAKAGGSGTVNVTAAGGCNWTAVSNASWITATGGASGSGTGTVNYTVGVNTGLSRTGTITIADQMFTINQSGGTRGR